MGVLLFTGLYAQMSDTYMQMVTDAEVCCKRGQWPQAEETLRSAMRLEPDNPLNVMLLTNIGMLKFYQGDNAGALAVLDSAHNLSPRSAVILENRANVLLAQNRPEEALADYDVILGADSLNTYVRYMRGLLRLQRNDTIGSRADFLTLDRIAPDSLETNIAWASYTSMTGDWQECERRLNRVIVHDPSPEFLIERARARINTGNLQGASDDLGRALLHLPEEAEIFMLRAEVNYQCYLFDDAAADARKAVSLGADPARAAKYLR